MIIQKLEPSKHKQGRWLVWLEDGSLVRVGEAEVLSLGLYVGKELTDQEGEALAAASCRAKLNERAMSLLTARPMSRSELVDKLATPPHRRGKPGGEEAQLPDPGTWRQQREALRPVAEEVADHLTELGLLDDRQYAHTLTRHYAAKGYGVRKLRDELYRRGVPREFWEEALAQVQDNSQTIDALLQRKLKGDHHPQAIKKASDALVRRGYSWTEISDALRRYGMDVEDC